jgi:hypothetical protein
VEESELYGIYVADYGSGTEKLTLQTGGRYVQEVSVKESGKVTTNNGPWKYEPKSNRVELDGCLGVNDGFGKIRADFAANRGRCSFSVARRWFVTGRLRLGPDEPSSLWKIE